jgi:Eco57I restriction-modification methylase/N-6 DNA Methylase/Type I restriction enzyme R protein N terminus (HSDR_N)
MASRDQLRLSVGATQNRNLFPVHFLEDRLPEWPEYADLDTSELFRVISEIWERERELLPGFNEEQTEDRLIRPILRALGFEYTARPDLSIAGRRREPDYALFVDEATRADAERGGGQARYTDAVAVVEAKRFDRPLDRRRATGSLSEDPVAQIIHYVSTTRVPFGVLTNGRIWRLYAEKGDLVEGAYYEVDLVALLESGDPRELRQFAAFFSAESLRPDEAGKSFLDRALDESRANAVAVGDALQRQVFSAMPNIALGLLGADEPSSENLKAAFEHSLVFLYRLLFCLHAEARGLLPIDSPHYLEYSVRKQRQELAEAIDQGRRFGHASARFYNDLEALFKLVDSGDVGLGVNEYNGGLFRASNHPWLEGRVVPDDLLAPALDAVYRVNGQTIDYRDLSVRHLGTIYERLLAQELTPADGRLELRHAEGRRDTGSYFTPEPIVDLIVEKTLDPLLERRSSEIREEELRGDKALEAFLGIRVLDPAMGSGHFLVSAAAYIAQFIATDPSYDGGLEWREIQRLVAERCLYGVDLNPMAVELARLALWLSTVRGDEPLTFLSNLRIGNSLVGADFDDLRAEESTLFAERLARDAEPLLERTAEIAAMRSESGEAVHAKERVSTAVEALREPLHKYADESIAPYFSDPGPMFHWEIEFPAVFLTADGGLQSDRGFDAVIGNPPYIRIQSLGRELAEWCRERYHTAFGSFDAYLVFIERAVGLLGPGGRLGFIVPNKFLKLDAGKKLRESLAGDRLVEEIVDFADAQLFEGATNYTCILVLDTAGKDGLSYRKVLGERDGIPTAREIEGSVPESFGVGGLGEDPWVLLAKEERQVFDAASQESERLGDVTEAIFTGLQTSADSVYILDDRGPRGGGRLVYSKAMDEELLLEPDLLHPLASGTDVEAFAFKTLGKLLLFPYRREDGTMQLITKEELATLPKTDAYLRTNEESLRGRERGKMNTPEWYAFGRTQSLALHDFSKLGIPRLCNRLRASGDPDGKVYLDNVDVNGILPSGDGPTLWTLLCVLNSRLLDFIFKLGTVPFRGNFYSANKQFIAPLPIRIPGAGAATSLDALGQRLHRAAAALHGERGAFALWLSAQVGLPLAGLAGHTRLEPHDALSPAEIVDVLVPNAGRLSVDPRSRAFVELLTAEHRASMEKIDEHSRVLQEAEAAVEEAVFDLYEISATRRATVRASYGLE